MISMFYMFTGSQDQSKYISQIEEERKEKDAYMRTDPTSPFNGSTESFKGLAYYPVDSKYKVQAELEPIEEKKIVNLGTNDGKQRAFVPYAYAAFDLDGFRNRLLILEVIERGPEKGKLFLAFGDRTSAEETYGAGRYLDLEKSKTNLITLDFNKAYNPYCAYSAAYSCPLPPSENLLNIPIKAGEKNYSP